MGLVNHNIKKYGSISPGPGTYKADKRDSSLSYSMGMKLSNQNKSQNLAPAPGQYNPKNNHKYDGHTKFGQGRRLGMINENKARLVPGPNVYNPNDSYSK